MQQLITLRSLPRAAGLVLFLLGVLAVYNSTLLSLLERWNQSGSEYSHGPLLVGVILWLIYRERQYLQRAEIKFSYSALLLAALFSLVWSAGYITQVDIVQQVALPCVLFFSISALLGVAVARIIWFPLALIVFALPLWNILQPSLQYAATTVCTYILTYFRIPAHIQGNSITLTAGTFQIAAGCSGLNLFLAASLLGTLVAHLNFRSRRAKFMIVLLALLVGVVCNWVRIITIILVAQFSDDMHHPIVQDHAWLGWLLFAILFSVYLGFVNRLPITNAGAPAAEKTLLQQIKRTSPDSISLAALVISLLSVCSAPLLSIHLLHGNRSAIFPLAVPGTVFGHPAQKIATAPTWRPHFQNASSELHLRVALQPEPVDFHLYFYAAQAQGAELIHFDNSIADPKLWQVRHLSNRGRDPNADWWQDAVIEAAGPGRQETRLVRYWYSIAGSNTNNPTTAKILQLKGFASNRSDAALVAISSTCAEQDCEAAQQLLDQITAPAILEANTIIANALAGRSTGK